MFGLSRWGHSSNKACFEELSRLLKAPLRLSPERPFRSGFINNDVFYPPLNRSWKAGWPSALQPQHFFPARCSYTINAKLIVIFDKMFLLLGNQCFFSNFATKSRQPVPGYQILGSISWHQILATRSWLPDPGYQILSNRSWLPGPVYRILATRVPNARYQI